MRQQLAVLLLLALSSKVCQGQEKGALLQLRSRWKGTPFIAEAAEFAGNEGASFFWKFLELSLETSEPADATRCWSHIMNLTTSVVQHSVSKLAPLVVSSRQYSPKLEMLREVGAQLHPSMDEQTCCMVDIQGTQVTSSEQLSTLLQTLIASSASDPPLEDEPSVTDTEQVFAFDHVFEHGTKSSQNQTGRGRSPPLAVLYGPIGNVPCTRALHSLLSKASKQKTLQYVFRPVLNAKCLDPTAGLGACALLGSQESPLLPGWGVEAVLKNTEYSAMDEKDKQAAEEEAAARSAQMGAGAGEEHSGASSLGEHKGFLFDRLVERLPGSRQEILTFRDSLLSSDEEEAVKIWDIADVGLQAAQRIMQASDPLALFTEVSQNFPSLVSSLSRQKVNESLREAVKHNQKFISPGMNFMLVNGLAVDINTLDLFGLFDRLRMELGVSDALSRLGLPSSVSQQVLQLRVEDESDGITEARLDMGLSPGGSGERHVFWLNDLEKDTMYTQRFSTSISDILNTFPGRLRPLAVNAFNLVLILDPTSAEGILLSDVVHSLWQEFYPIRFGISLKVPELLTRLESANKPPYSQIPTPDWEQMTAAERFGRAFLTLENAFGGAAAFKLWEEVSMQVQSTQSWGSDADDRLKPAFVEAWSAAAKSPPKSKGAKSKVAAKKKPEVVWGEIKTGSGSAAEAGIRLSEMALWQKSKGLSSFTGPSAWLNGVQAPFSDVRNPHAMQHEMIQRLIQEQQNLQEAVYYGKVVEGKDTLTQLLKHTGSVSRWNPSIIKQQDASAKVISLAPLLANPNHLFYLPAFAIDSQGQLGGNATLLEEGNAPGDSAPSSDSKGQEAASEDGKKGGKKKGDKEGGKDKGGKAKNAKVTHVKAVTHVVVVNLEDVKGRHLLGQAMRFMSEGLGGAKDSRLIILLNPSSHSGLTLDVQTPTLLELSAHLAFDQMSFPPEELQIENARTRLSNVTAAHVAKFLSDVVTDAPLAELISGKIHYNRPIDVKVLVNIGRQAGIATQAFMDSILKFSDVYPDANMDDEPIELYYAPPDVVKLRRRTHAALVRDLGLPAGSSAVISNGRVFSISSGPSLVSSSDSSPDAEEEEPLMAEDFSLLSLLATKYQPGASLAKILGAAHSSKQLPSVRKPLTALGAVRLDILAAAASAVLATGRPQDAKAGQHGQPSVSKQLSMVMTHMKGRTIEVGTPLPTAEEEGGEPAPEGRSNAVHIVCILNPLTRQGQRISQVLSLLRTSPLAPSISLVLNPQRDLSELPLKSFYRFALPDLAPGDAAFMELPGPPIAFFKRLPKKRVLTLNMDTPEPWLVEAVQAAHDLDNLRLADIPERVVHAELELRALMLTGSCIDVTQSRGTPPRGLQLQLGPPGLPPQVDTLVMSNLAYFQLKAAPGRWELSLAPGRSQELYLLESSDGITGSGSTKSASSTAVLGLTDGSTNELSTQVVVSSLAGKHMVLRVRKRPGKEEEDVLLAAGEKAEDDRESMRESDPFSFFLDDDYDADPSSFTDKAQALALKPGSDGSDEVINIFTVASGHMYERLQKIMMLSVLNHTKSKVKFWFISNYMSPQHKQVIPLMAEHYNFEYGFVTYKWPHWLHKQTDKQRIIWAYKILFLDVLFPLSVQRIIFVDSDQVVRTDLAELYHMDLKGAPYAYTPFCDNNKEMDEFRFWKGGFWHSHLQGKPYHISALYLVDVKRLRAMAAGDQLRVIYDQLSKDPNSLANLDQDLPNYAQGQIKIFSLPQEWLWCESWCGNSTKSKAKTIDLCNNPKTKEPKLSAARRIISEWPSYDQEQAEFTQQVEARLAASSDYGPSSSLSGTSSSRSDGDALSELESDKAVPQADCDGSEQAEWAAGGSCAASPRSTRHDASEL